MEISYGMVSRGGLHKVLKHLNEVNYENETIIQEKTAETVEENWDCFYWIMTLFLLIFICIFLLNMKTLIQSIYIIKLSYVPCSIKKGANTTHAKSDQQETPV